jgi:hypothetical protein
MPCIAPLNFATIEKVMKLMFPLTPELSDLHDSGIAYASVIQNDMAASGGCTRLSSEALNALMFSAVLTHRSVRTLCEEGWTPITSVLNRTLLDIFANCVALLAKPADADFMGFKYMTHFQRKWLKEPNLSAAEGVGVGANIEEMVNKLKPAEQAKARTLLTESEVTPYWFQPEFGSPKKVLAIATHPIYELYKLLSGPTHGGFAMKVLFNDDVASENINPREHPRNTPKAIVASTRLLTEVCYLRDHWENSGAGDLIYQDLITRISNYRLT